MSPSNQIALRIFFQTGKELSSMKEHENLINDMQWNKDGTMFVTASKDHTAKLFDATDLLL
jgi:translation initiation factor 3 subunit I